MLRWRGRSIIIGTYILGLLSALLLGLLPNASIFAASAGLALLYAMGNVHPVAMTEAQAWLPDKMRGIGLGALNTLVFLGVSASSAVFGALAELHLSVVVTCGLIFGTTAMALGTSLAIYVACRPRYGQERGAAAATDGS